MNKENIVEVRTQYRIEQWKLTIQECRSSGLSITQFCKQNNLSIHAYYYWLKKIRENLVKQAAVPTEVEFAQLPVNSNSEPPQPFKPQQTSGKITIKCCGVSIEIAGYVDSDSLKSVLQSLKDMQSCS